MIRSRISGCENTVETLCESRKYPVLFQVFHIRSVQQNDGSDHCADLPAAFVSCIMEYIQMQEACMAEKGATIADLRKLVDELQSLKANLKETLMEFRRQFFGISLRSCVCHVSQNIYWNPL